MSGAFLAGEAISCSDCSRSITKRAKTGRCRSCSARITGRKNVESGRIQGRKNVESGHLARLRTPEHQRKAGRVGGRKSVESGHLRRISSLGGRINGRKNVESGHIQALGRIYGRINGYNGGRKNVESGWIQALGRRAGRIAGRKNVESGQLARIARGVLSTADGILFRSQTEASFYCVVKELGGEPVYEPGFIKLSDGTSYMPDFVLGKSVLGIPDSIPIELKPARSAYYNGNVEKAVRAGATVVYWDELVE